MWNSCEGHYFVTLLVVLNNLWKSPIGSSFPLSLNKSQSFLTGYYCLLGGYSNL